MTKKDKAESTSKVSDGGDFFDNISVDLQSQFVDFQEKKTPSKASAEESQDNSELFATDSSSSMSELDEAEGSVFDTSSAEEPSSTSHDDSEQPQSEDAPEEPQDMNSSEKESTSEEEKAASPEDVQAPETQAESEPEVSNEELAEATDTNEETSGSSVEAAADKDEATADSSDSLVASPEVEETPQPEAEVAEEASVVEASDNEEASANAEETTEANAEDDLELSPEESSDEEEVSKSGEEVAEASSEEEESTEAKEIEDLALASEEDDVAEESLQEDEAPVVVVQKKPTPRTENYGDPLQFEASKAQTIIGEDENGYVLENPLHELKNRVVWHSTKPSDGEQQPEYAMVLELSPSEYRASYQHFPDLSENNVLAQPKVFEEEDRTFLVFDQPQGYCLTDKIRDPQHHWTIQQLQGLIHQLGRSLEELHNAGHLFLQLNDHDIWIQPDRSPVVNGVDRVYSNRTPNHLLPIHDGFSAPEIYHQNVPVGPYTDVFALGALLHYMISQCPPFNHLDLPDPYIPSLRIYQLDFPVGLDHVLFQACHPDTALRYQSVDSFLNALDLAIAEIETRHRSPNQKLDLAVAHDIHIGINKGQRNPTNQDALFWRFDKKLSKGLFIIADGVSHCHYGSGDRASSILIASAREHWNLFIQKEAYQKPTPSLQRRRFIQSIFDAANAAISREVNQLYERVDGYVEDVMGSTCVMAFLDGNEVTIANLGDSRSYLKTPSYIEQINVDHDYKTAQLQVGCDLRSTVNLMGASLITRCVGSCRKDENLKVVPLKLQPDFFELKLKRDDILVLCSDGLSDYAGNSEAESRETIAKILDVHTEPISAVFWLVALANQRGGGDNISVIEIKVKDTI